MNKQLAKVPSFIAEKFRFWAAAVEGEGIRHIRKLSGYHDEPLKGKRKGQRSVRLSRAYRAIYVETAKGDMEIIDVIEVTKHEY